MATKLSDKFAEICREFNMKIAEDMLTSISSPPISLGPTLKGRISTTALPALSLGGFDKMMFEVQLILLANLLGLNNAKDVSELINKIKESM